MQYNPSNKVRAFLYVLTAVGTPIVAYLFAKHHIGELEVTLWSAEVAVVNAMAALNVKVTKSTVPNTRPLVIQPDVAGRQGSLKG